MSVTIGKSAKLYQERRGLRDTLRGPRPRFAPGNNKAHRRTLSAPLPLPVLLQDLDGNPPIDPGLTRPWPHGAVDIQ